MRKTLFTASALALALAAPFAQAFEAGDIIVRAGAITVDPHEDSSDINHAVLGDVAGDLGAAHSRAVAALTPEAIAEVVGLGFYALLGERLRFEHLPAQQFAQHRGGHVGDREHHRLGEQQAASRR